MAVLSRLKRVAQIHLKLAAKPLVISSGMPRSGSTLAFNILRETLAGKWPQLSAGWEGDLLRLPRGEAYLVKTHEVDRYFLLRARHAIYTYRDMRVAAVSALRKFNRVPTIESFRAAVAQYRVAKNERTLMLRYEDMIVDPQSAIEAIARRVEVAIDPAEIARKTIDLKPPSESRGGYSPETLLHEGHFTHTQDDEWREVLSPALQDEVNSEFGWWFEECGYALN